MRIRFRAFTTTRLRTLPGSAKDRGSNILSDYGWSVIDTIREYPPVPANSQYERTNKLYQSWDVSIHDTAGEISMYIVNDVMDDYGRFYAQYVQGKYQTWFHAAHGWIKASTAIDRSILHTRLRKLYKEYLNAID